MAGIATLAGTLNDSLRISLAIDHLQHPIVNPASKLWLS